MKIKTSINFKNYLIIFFYNSFFNKILQKGQTEYPSYFTNLSYYSSLLLLINANSRFLIKIGTWDIIAEAVFPVGKLALSPQDHIFL